MPLQSFQQKKISRKADLHEEVTERRGIDHVGCGVGRAKINDKVSLQAKLRI